MIIKRILLVLVAVFVWSVVYSQESNAISYQAIARDASGATVKDKEISVRISIIVGSASGEVVYQEIHHQVTDKSGVVSLMIGKGETSDDFSGINWSGGVFYLRTEMDVDGGSNYSSSSTCRMVSVPYALYAEKSTVLNGNFVMADDMTLANVLSNGNDADGQQIKGLAVPTDGSDAINKAYMDSVIGSYIPRTVAALPEPYTRRAYDITATEAKLRGRITSDGGALVEEKGFLVGRQQESLTDSVSCGAGKGDFICRLSGLEPNTTYYYKLYAMNSEGVAYGDVKSFTTSDLFVDERDGTTYTMVNLGSRTWMAENLRYEGDIPVGTEGSSTEAYRYFPMGEESNVQTYGYLYNMTAAMNGATDSVSSQGYIRGICPAGWHIPSRNDVQTLSAYNLGGHFDTFNYYEYWDYETNDVFGTSGFNMLNSGEFHSGTYTDNYYSAFWLAPEQNDVANAWVYSGSGWHFEKYDAVSMRCIRDVGINATVPTISAAAIDIYSDRATLHGIVMDDGGTLIVDNGFQYGTDSTSLGGNIQSDDISAFTHTLSGLIPNTTYYIRSYATNSNGTVWSGISSFSTHGNFVDERDGNVYDTITIGNQTWMAVNLRYEGDIPLGNGNAEIAYRDYPNGDANNVEIYGYLYNWTAAMNGASGSSDNPSGVQGICPNGWHLPSNAEWIQLVENIGGEDNAGAQLAGNSNLWNYYEYDGCLVCSPQFGTSGFNAQPVDDSGIGSYAYFWTATEYDDYDAYVRSITYTSTSLSRYTYYKGSMFSVRCVLGEGVLSNVSVVTQSATEISTTTATLHGLVTSDGGEEIISRGFIYGTDSNNLTENVQSADETDDFAYTLTYLEPNTTYYYKAYARNSTGTGYGEVIEFTTSSSSSTVTYSQPTGYVDGYGYVDMGLPSGTLWAYSNVGATIPEEYGDYFAWGETTPHYSVNGADTIWLDGYEEGYAWSNYNYCDGSDNTLIKYCDDEYRGLDGFTDTLITLEAMDDAATANWGEGWRMPTETELVDLVFYCDTTWTTQNNVAGMLFTSRINGNSIFLPAGDSRYNSDISDAGSFGTYWSSSLNVGYPDGARYLYFNSDDYGVDVHTRSYGLSVRPVCDASSAPSVTTQSVTDLTATSATLHATITSDGGADITSRGFIYGTDADNLAETVQSTDVTTDFAYTLTGLTPSTTYYYKAFATNSEGTGYGEVMSFTTSPTTGQLSGHTWVDLGLPSGLLWATTNVGADNPEDYGDYYAWGETQPHYSDGGTTDNPTWLDGYEEGYELTTYIYAEGTYDDPRLTKYCYDESLGNEGFTDNLGTLESSDDAAIANWGSGWRMPTYDEQNELYNNCIHEWTSQNGVNGRLFTGPNGNSIFLPAAGNRIGSELLGAGSDGCYWSCSLGTSWSIAAWDLNFGSDYYDMGEGPREDGFSVRPVCTRSSLISSAPTITTSSATNISSTSATLHATITFDGGADITSRGFIYGDDSDNLTETVQSTDETADFAFTLTGLTLGATYYYKAFATNSEGTGFGNILSFTTLYCNETYYADTIYACDSLTWIDGNTYTESTNTPTYTLTNAQGCDSILTLHLTLYHFEETEFDITACDSYQWNDSIYTQSGDYIQTFPNINGCDSVVTLHLTMICPPTLATQSATEISSTSAILHATITSNGGADITSRGFIYGTDADNLAETVQSTDVTTDFAYTLTGLTPSTTYYYKAFATNSEGTGYGEVMSFTTSPTTGQLSGHTWVDLGLPSGTRWATTNVGAENPEDYGDYYAWGETEPHYSDGGTTDNPAWLNGYEDGYSWTTYRYCNGSESTLTKYCNDSEYGDNGFTDTLTTLESTDDAATANWGAGWRMPTQEELQELDDNCIREWTEQNGVSGYLFTGPNGNFIFLPAAGWYVDSELFDVGSNGYYWSSSLVYPDAANSIFFFSSGSYNVGATNRNAGLSVRPVCVSAQNASSSPAITTSSATNISSTSATLHATITSNGGADITSRGFIYGTDADNLAETVQSTDVTTDFAYTLTGLTPSTTYYYKAYATNSEGTGYGDVMSFTTSPTTGQLSGHTWVDLGLPSGTRWATTNVGAENPEDYGDYYAWGETEPHYSDGGTTDNPAWLNGYEDGYSWTTYRYCNGSESTLTKYCNDSEYGDNGFTDTLTTLESTDDAATANWGAGWRMPTQEELQELDDNCIREWTEQNGVSGYLFTGPNGNSIFLPAAGYRRDSELYDAGSYGYYWSSSLYTDYTDYAWSLYFGSGNCGMDNGYRYCGFSVRAVCQSQN